MEEIKKDEALKRIPQQLRRIRATFHCADSDKDGFITRGELLHSMNTNPKVMELFNGFGLDSNDALELFSVLDWDRTGGITIDEFVDGISKVLDNEIHILDHLASHAGIRTANLALGFNWPDGSLNERVGSI